MTQEKDIHASFWEHVLELRATALKCLSVIALGTIGCLYFHQTIFAALEAPLAYSTPNSHLQVETIKTVLVSNTGNQPLSYRAPPATTPQSTFEEAPDSTYLIPPGKSVAFAQRSKADRLVILSPAEGLTTIFKLSFWLGLTATSPVWLFFIFQFIAPALRIRERRIIIPFALLSILFSALGGDFAYTVTIPLANSYLMEINDTLGTNLWTLSGYLGYSLLLILANALAFECFVILLFLVHYQFISAQWLVRQRRVAIVLIFILAALLTPPDVLSQVMLALPLMGLYELGILYARVSARIRKQPTVAVLDHNET